MKIGIVGPQKSIDNILSSIEESGTFVEAIPAACSTRMETVDIVDSLQSSKAVDSFLFTGYIPFFYATAAVNPTIPWEYAYRDKGALLAVLLKAIYVEKYGIEKISSDLREDLTEQQIKEALLDTGIEEDKIKILEFGGNYINEDYIDRAIDFHCENIRHQKMQVCITGIDTIEASLKSLKYPVLRVYPTVDTIIQQINKLRFHQQMVISDDNKIAMISIEVQYFPESLQLENGEYLAFSNWYRCLDAIYLFAQKIDASVEVHGHCQCYLYTTKAMIENETAGFQKLGLFHMLMHKFGVKSIFVGIGLGNTHVEAKGNADYGRLMAARLGSNCFYTVFEERKIVGPIVIGKKNPEEVLLNRQLYEISRRTGVGMKTLDLFERIMKQYGKTIITTYELLQLSGMTNSNLNRILAKLDAGGFVEVVGNQALAAGAGRPRRLLKFKFDI